jgi:hypothetical protein
VQIKQPKRLYNVEIEFANGLTKNVPIKAISRVKAEDQALKQNPSATRVKR